MAAAYDSDRRTTSSFQGWWAVGVFSVAAVLSYTDRQILTLLVDPLRADLRISDTQLSILQGAAFAVLYSCIGLPLGRIADIVPRKAQLLTAVIIWSLGTALCGLAHSFGELFAARLLVGVGEAAFAPAAMSLIADYFPADRRATATGVFFTGMAIGAGGAVAIGGALLDAAQHGVFASLPFIGALAPWRIVLMLAGLAGVVIAVLFATLHDPITRTRSLRELRSRLAIRETVAPFLKRLPLLFPLYAAMALCSTVDYAMLSWAPSLLSRNFAFTPLQVGASLGTIAIVASIVGTPAGGILTDWCTKRWGSTARPRLMLGIVVFGILGAPMGVLATGTQILIAAACWILVSAVLGIVSIATTLDLLPIESRGLATSTIAFSNTIVGLGLGPTLVALTTDHIYGSPAAVGLAITTVITPLILLACLFYYFAMQRWDRMTAMMAWTPA
ncbi:MAG TPA: MFS transporter [Rhizomicrobium sp.]|jgi:MFS family permease|nr:MFS transporter [Rhizomicrobium sp.]